MSRVVITLVTWNSMKYIPDTLASIKMQTHEDLNVVVVDNGSMDGSINCVRDNYPEVIVLRNTKNLGFSRAHNQAIEYARTHLKKDGEDIFVLVTNPDIILETDFVEKLVGRIEHRTDIGSAGGKLLRVWNKADGDMSEKVFSDTIDSTGIQLFKSRKTGDRATGETDNHMFERTGEVFGISGALVMYRMSALEDVAYQGEYFDEEFFAYKEDIDLAWRLRLRGWISLYVPAARAYHFRRVAEAKRKSVISILRGRRDRTRAVNRFSYRNHLLTLVKNDYVSNFLLHLPRIYFREIGKALYLLMLEPSTLGALSDFARLLPSALRKRRFSMQRAKVNAKGIRSWMV